LREHDKPIRRFKGIILVFLVGLIFPWYPSLVPYYYIVKQFNLYSYSSFVYATIWTLYLLLCVLGVIFLFGKISLLLRSYSINILYRYFISFIIIFLIVFLLDAGLAFTLLNPIEKDIIIFNNNTRATCNGSSICTVREVIQYVDSRVKWSYRAPQSALEIDNMLSFTFIDYRILGKLGFTRAHVILWQGYGSCGEHAIVTAFLLNSLGYDVRVVRFSDIDHQWAEVYLNNTWYIVDPWYIGHVYEREFHGNKYLVPAGILASLDNFSGNHVVTCVYINGTRIDCTREHGYMLSSG
jgi:hypothetical protein